jgi:hypothetical protein
MILTFDLGSPKEFDFISGCEAGKACVVGMRVGKGVLLG